MENKKENQQNYSSTLDEKDTIYETEILLSIYPNKNNGNIDMDGEAVRNRFYKIMEDYHSDDDKKKKYALERAMKEMEGFIITTIRKSYSTYIREHYNDLLQEGYLGVAVGMKKYNPQKSTPSTFFYPYIKHEIQQYINTIVNKTSAHYSSNIQKVSRAITSLKEKQVNYKNIDIALQTNLSIDTVEQTLKVMHCTNEIHIDDCLSNEIEREVSANQYHTPEQEFIEKEMTSALYESMQNTLSERELKIIQWKFGLDDETTISETEIARRLSISKEMVKRTLTRAIKTLRTTKLKEFCENRLEEFPFLEDIKISSPLDNLSSFDWEFMSQIDGICD